MTIASAFNEIAVANGGQADTSGTIAGAVDALTDALAGSDVAQGATIEDGVRVLGEYIGGGGGGGSQIVDVYTSFDGIDWPAPTIEGVAVTLEVFDANRGLYKFSAPVGAIVSMPRNTPEIYPAYSIFDSLDSIIGSAIPIVNFVGAAPFSGDTKFPPVASLPTFIGFAD